MSDFVTRYAFEQRNLDREKIDAMKKDFPSLFGLFLDHMIGMNRSTKTVLSYAYDLKIFLVYLAQVFGVTQDQVTMEFLSSLKPIDIDNFLAFSASYRSESDVAYNKRHPQKADKRYHTNSAAAQSKKLTVLRQFYRYLQKYYNLPSNPAALADSPKLEKSKEVLALDDSEVCEVLSDVESGAKLQGRRLVFAQKTQLRDTAILKLMLGTGIRVSELVGIDIHHINWAKHYIEVYRKERKNQRVFMPEDVESALITYIENERKPADKNDKSLFISPRTGTRLTVRSVERIVKKYAVPVGGERIHAHSMRSTYATNLYRNTQDINLVADALGHNDLETVKKYTKSGEENRERAAKKVNYETQ